MPVSSQSQLIQKVLDKLKIVSVGSNRPEYIKVQSNLLGAINIAISDVSPKFFIKRLKLTFDANDELHPFVYRYGIPIDLLKVIAISSDFDNEGGYFYVKERPSAMGPVAMYVRRFNDEYMALSENLVEAIAFKCAEISSSLVSNSSQLAEECRQYYIYYSNLAYDDERVNTEGRRAPKNSWTSNNF